MEYTIYAFPLFALLLGIEMLVSRSNPEYRYRANNTISNLSTGLFDNVLNAFSMTIFIGLYHLLQTHYSFFSFNPTSVLAGILLFIGVDFAYYWFHRLSHRINFLWAAHIGHHQSESYDLSVSLRHSIFSGWINKIFYIPLAFLGFPAVLFILVHALFQSYQFFVHTHLISSFGTLDAVIASPKLHQVHHARNGQYLDINYGGVFIIWDRLFGTFKKKEKKIKILYGITTGIREWNPIWASFHYLAFLWKAMKNKNTLKDKILVWIAPPDWEKLDYDHEEVGHKFGYNESLPNAWNWYGIGQFVIIIIGAWLLLIYHEVIPFGIFWLSVSYILVSTVVITSMYDHKMWSISLEGLRHIVVIIVLAILFISHSSPVFLFLFFIPLISCLWFFLLRTRSEQPFLQSA